MGTIVITPLVSGAFVSTDTLNNDFRKLSEINGKLNTLNTASIDRLLDYTYVQLGAVSGGKMVGGTANLDYFNNVRYVFDRGENNNLAMQGFNRGHLDYLSEDRVLANALGGSSTLKIGKQRKISEFPGVIDAAEAPATIPRAIPGASTTYYVPYRAHVLVTWQVTWTSDAARLGNTPSRIVENAEEPNPADFIEPNVAIRFYVDGAEHAKYSTTRESRETMFAQQIDDFAWTEYGSNRLPVHKLRDRHKSRYWSGHAYVGIQAKGFHTTSLRVISREIVRQTRVRARNIKVIYFKA